MGFGVHTGFMGFRLPMVCREALEVGSLLWTCGSSVHFRILGLGLSGFRVYTFSIWASGGMRAACRKCFGSSGRSAFGRRVRHAALRLLFPFGSRFGGGPCTYLVYTWALKLLSWEPLLGPSINHTDT